jgi:type I restriction enzyme, S subunit
MNRWPTRPLGELCDVEGGNAAPQGVEYFKDGTIPFVRMKDLGRQHLTNNLTETEDKLTEVSAAANRMKFFEPGSILFPRSGSVALNHRAILGVSACIVSHIGVLHELRPEITAGYLYLYLTTFDMTRLSKKTTGVDSIAFSDVRRIPVPVPPVAEQERIVKLLDEADELRKLRAQADRRASDFIPALFHDVFGDPASNMKGWPQFTLGEMCQVVTGNTPPRDKPELYGNFIEWVKADDIDAARGVVDRASELLSQQGATRGRVVPAGSVIVTCIAGSLGHIGDAAIADRKVAINQQLNALLSYDKVDSIFLWQLVRSLKKVIQRRTTSDMIRIINKSAFAGITGIRPPLGLQREFAAAVRKFRELQDEQRASRERLDALFQSMLHRAFRGEL